MLVPPLSTYNCRVKFSSLYYWHTYFISTFTMCLSLYTISFLLLFRNYYEYIHLVPMSTFATAKWFLFFIVTSVLFSVQSPCASAYNCDHHMASLFRLLHLPMQRIHKHTHLRSTLLLCLDSYTFLYRGYTNTHI